MRARIAAALVGLALLAAGCDSGSDSSRPSTGEPDAAGTPWYESPEIVEACRGVFERLPPESRDATTEEAFIDKCQAAVSGLPDPGLNELS